MLESCIVNSPRYIEKEKNTNLDCTEPGKFRRVLFNKHNMIRWNN